MKKVYLSMIVIALVSLACRVVSPSGVSPVQPLAPAAPEAPAAPLSPATPVAYIALPEVVTDEQTALVNLYTRINPSVVNITIYVRQGDTLEASGQGSGFVFDAEGNIVTNSHVVQDAEDLEVTFSEGTVRKGKVVGTDLNSDLAVVKVESMPPGVTGLPLGDLANVKVGETVVAIGNPFGLDGTLTKGIISAVGRSIPSLTQFSIPQAIQTDAPINPGNSGGPLLNLKGEVIGVNAQIETSGTSRSNSGVGFAIPVSIVQRVVPEIIQNGKYTWTWLGVRGGSLYPTMVEAMDLPIEKGAYLAEVLTGGPADKAGLRGATEEKVVDNRKVEVGGDVITAIDGITVNSFDDLLIYVALQTRPGQEVTLTILRDGQTQQVKVVLEPRPASNQE